MPRLRAAAPRLAVPAAVLLVTLAAACGDRDARPAEARAAVTRIAAVGGFRTPESAIHDPAQDVWFVTNIEGVPSAKDGNGFISRLTADGAIEALRWVEGGRDGVVLHAPKGQAVVGDTLWVTDIDAVRGFHTRTGAPLATIEFGARALFLNDLVAAPDGSLYVSDTGVRIDESGFTHPGPDRIFRITPDRAISVVAEGDALQGPNGLAWEAGADRLVIVAFLGPTLLARGADGTVQAIGGGPGQHDGVELLRDGRLVVSSWADSSLFVLRAGGPERLLGGVEAPADIGQDVARGRLMIPLFTRDSVELWQVAGGAR